MKKLVLFTLIMALCMSFSTSALASIPQNGGEYKNKTQAIYSQKFTDVTPNHWAFNYISEMVERSILSGYPDGGFYPGKTITRAEFSKTMCLAANLPVTPVDTTTYVDVAPNAWYAPFVECGKYYLSGYISNEEKYYLPQDNALREDIAVALVKLKGYDTSNYDESILKAKFTDWQSISEDSRKYVFAAIENELISGYEVFESLIFV